jgi:tetratricopeptide (TPR) repeat protein
VAESLPRLEAALTGRYTIERELGRGGMATVYLARDLRHDRPVALKVLRPELAAVLGAERFLREIRLTAQLQHPHILTLIDSGEAGGFLYYVMPYVEGQSLRQRLEREGQLPLDEALRITRAIAMALDFAHGRGVIHRDIKPENIMLHQGEPMVADFGIALAVSMAGRERLTETGLSLGTPAYMSPEQATADQHVDARSDIYSLGCVLYEMLAGEPPYTGPTAQAIIAKRFSEPIPHVRTVRAGVPEAIEHALNKALARAPADRYAKAAEFTEAIDRAGEARGAQGARWRLSGVLVLGFLVGVGVLFAWRHMRGAGLDPRRVVVAPFENRTGDARLDPVGKMARDWLTRGILATGLVEVSDPAAWVSGVDSGAKPTLRALAEATGAGTIVSGAFYRAGDSLRFEVAIADARRGQVLRALPPLGGPATDPARALEPLRQATMAGLAAVFDPRLSTWVDRATAPPSYEAYVEFVAGQDAFWADNRPEAIRHFARARSLDTSFVTARTWEIVTLWENGQCARADSLGHPLEARQASLPSQDRSRLLRSLLNCRGDHEGALAIARRQLAADPKSDYVAHVVATTANMAYRPREALAVMRGRDPKRGWLAEHPDMYVSDLAEAHHFLGDYRAALREAVLGRRRAPRNWRPVVHQLWALAALGRLDDVRALLPDLESLAPDAGAALAGVAAELRTHGQPAAAREVAERAVDWYRSRAATTKDSVATLAQMRNALYLAESWGEAERVAQWLAARDTTVVHQWGWLGLLAAHRGDTATALRMDSLIASRPWPFAQGFPAVWRADIAALLGRREQAEALFKEALAEGLSSWDAHMDFAYSFYAPFKELLRPGQ